MMHILTEKSVSVFFCKGFTFFCCQRATTAALDRVAKLISLVVSQNHSDLDKDQEVLLQFQEERVFFSTSSLSCH